MKVKLGDARTYMAKTGGECYPPYSSDKGAISVGKADLDFDVDDLERLLPRTEQRRGRGRKCVSLNGLSSAVNASAVWSLVVITLGNSWRKG